MNAKTLKKIIDNYYVRTQAGAVSQKQYERQQSNLTQILETLDIDPGWLKGSDGKYVFPDGSEEFIFWVLDTFSCSWVQDMRRANFDWKNAPEIERMVNGFSKILRELSTESEYNERIYRIINRTMLPLLKQEFEFHKAVNHLDSLFDRIRNNISLGVKPDDELCFLEFATREASNLTKRLEDIYWEFDDICQDEMSNIFDTEIDDAKLEEYAMRQWILAGKVMSDSRYVDAMRRKDDILSKDDFVHKLNPKYKKVCAEIENICRQLELDTFGDIVEKPPYKTPSRRSSESILEEAIVDYMGKNSYYPRLS